MYSSSADVNVMALCSRRSSFLLTRLSLSAFRMDSHGPSGSSSSQTGQNKVCQNQGKASSTSSAKCIKQKSSLVRMDPYRSTVGKKDSSVGERADAIVHGQNACLLF